jgi:hypothetical protein
MKPCPYCDPALLAGYYEGTLDPDTEREFSRHLLTCPQCLEALMDLERDLTLMYSSRLRTPPRERPGAVFQFGGWGLQILQNLAEPDIFQPVSLAALRGDRTGMLYTLQREGITLSLYAEGRDQGEVFSITLEGVAEKSVQLRGEGRVVERRSAGPRNRVGIENLEPGAYTVYIKNKEFISFVVQEEVPWT